MREIHFTYLSGPDIARLAMTEDEILDAVEGALRAQGRGETVIEPRVHLEPDPDFRGHFNVLRGYIAPLAMAGVKVVGDYVDNSKGGLPSEMALLNLFDPRTGMPLALLDATAITDMRTGAMTALGHDPCGASSYPCAPNCWPCELARAADSNSPASSADRPASPQARPHARSVSEPVPKGKGSAHPSALP